MSLVQAEDPDSLATLSAVWARAVHVASSRGASETEDPAPVAGGTI